MHTVKIGSNSEYLKIEIPSKFSSEGWGEFFVEIKTSHFQGNIRPWAESADIYKFYNELVELNESLKGSASFKPRDAQLVFNLEAKTGGHIEVTGEAWSVACYGSKLEFCFLLDQTFLQEPLNALGILVPQLNAIT